MTVQELIDELNRMVATEETTPSTEVITEGCDCVGDSNRVEIEDGKVIICRSR